MIISNVKTGATANERDGSSRSAALSLCCVFQGDSSMNMTNPGRGMVRRLGLVAAAMLVLSAASQERAEALSLESPGTMPATKYTTDGLTTQVRGGHGGGHGG